MVQVNIFHHKQGPQNPLKDGVSRLKREGLRKRISYGSYIPDELEQKTRPKKHKKNKERPRC